MEVYRNLDYLSLFECIRQRTNTALQRCSQDQQRQDQEQGQDHSSQDQDQDQDRQFKPKINLLIPDVEWKRNVTT